jgi:hypothetical protein
MIMSGNFDAANPNFSVVFTQGFIHKKASEYLEELLPLGHAFDLTACIRSTFGNGCILSHGHGHGHG